MASEVQRITIIRLQKPIRHDVNEELQWLGSSLGLFNLRDKDKSCFRIFIELLKSSKKSEALSSDAMAERLLLSRGTIVHHLNKLMECGLVIQRRNKYLLRKTDLQTLMETLHEDMERSYKELEDIAKDIDHWLNGQR